MLLNSATITIKTDPQTKSEAQALAEQLGLSLSSALNAMMRQFVRTRKLDLSLSVPSSLTDQAQKALKESDNDIKTGRVSPTFTHVKDAVEWLKSDE